MTTMSTPTAPVQLDPPPAGKKKLSPKEALAALRRVQDQAEHRIKLGTQLLKAAEAQAGNNLTFVEQMRAEQDELRRRFERDLTRRIEDEYGRIGQRLDATETGVARRMDEVEKKLNEALASQQAMEQRVSRLLIRAEAMFDQSRLLLEKAHTRLDRLTCNRRAGAAPGDQLKIAPQPEPPALSISASSRDDDIIEAKADDEPLPPPPAPLPLTQLYNDLLRKLNDRAEDESA